MTTPTITQPGIDELTLPNHPETKVWLKRRPRFAETSLVEAHAAVARLEVAPGKYQLDPNGFARWLSMRTTAMIHDWTVLDESGKKAPITIEALGLLDPEDGDFLATEAKARYEGTAGNPLVSNSEPTSLTESNSPIPEPSESPVSENS